MAQPHSRKNGAPQKKYREYKKRTETYVQDQIYTKTAAPPIKLNGKPTRLQMHLIRLVCFNTLLILFGMFLLREYFVLVHLSKKRTISLTPQMVFECWRKLTHRSTWEIVSNAQTSTGFSQFSEMFMLYYY